jgi:hypothetical protein
MICTLGKPRAGWCVSIQADHSVARVVDKMAIQYFRVGEIRRDVSINTIGLPILVTVGFNADFDGDEMNCMLINDRKMRQRCARLSPYLGLMSLRHPWHVSNNIKMPGPFITTLNNRRFRRAA